jgi:hypothetical protein
MARKLKVTELQTGRKFYVVTEPELDAASTRTGDVVATVIATTFLPARGTVDGLAWMKVETDLGTLMIRADRKVWPADVEAAATIVASAIENETRQKVDGPHFENEEDDRHPAPCGYPDLIPCTCSTETLAQIEEVSSSPATGSAIVSVLELVWAQIRSEHPELPEIVMVTGSAYVGPSRWGHFRKSGWTEAGVDVERGEMFIAGECLAKGARFTLETILHEAAHVLAAVRDVKDTSRQGRWHNAQFRKFAEEMGLAYQGKAADKSRGFSDMLLTAETEERYARLTDELNRQITMMIKLRGTESGNGEKITLPPAEGGGAAGGRIKLTCACSDPRILRVSKKTAEAGLITCGVCFEGFEDRG